MSKDPQSLPLEKLPQVTAFQDEFTRKFMDSTEPVKEGYYLFRSGVNGYTMLFPEGAKLSERGYSAPDKFFETIDFGGEEKNVTYYVRIEYHFSGTVNLIDSQLDSFRSEAHYNGEFKKREVGQKIMYIGNNEFLSDHKEDTAYNFFGFIKSKESNQGIRFFYSVTCLDAKKTCHLDVRKEEEQARILMESITFIEK
ncbi:hypothetical protein [Numidum massiliense]|uniref:hypothetical protein n=1 Tax=Numidum massiliense TaxID=1522315 RepID=UPI0009E90E76|nr:hypothetical protein [Numidum massiliense]